MLQPPRRLIAASVLSVSEGGFGVLTTARVEQGDSIRLRLKAQGSAPEFEVEAIVWYHGPPPSSRGASEQRLLGCVLPDPSPDFLGLFGELERRNAPPPSPMRSTRTPHARRAQTQDEDLPRSREPLLPPKPDPEESLPSFRVRLRQIGGPRTRNVRVQASTLAQAAELARSDASDGPGSERWAVLEVEPCVARRDGSKPGHQTEA